MNDSLFLTRERFADEIRRLMESEGLTQADVADRMNMRPQAIGAALAGRSPGTLPRIYEQITGRSARRIDAYEVAP